MSLPNYSIYSIPAYYVLTLAPHSYSIALISRASKKRWDNSNPRGSTYAQSIQKSVSPEVYAKYERARACHANGMENFPLFLATVILGNMAGLDKGYMNTAMAAYVGLRAAYSVAYITIESKNGSFARTGIWLSGVVICLWTIIKAGNVFAAKG